MRGWGGMYWDVCVHSFIYPFTVLQIVTEHLLCAGPWLGPGSSVLNREPCPWEDDSEQ